jgi:hypothetical protein
MEIRPISAIAAFALLSVAPAFAGLGRPTTQNVGGVPTLSGGIGEEERRQLEAIDDKFNLKLVFALDRSAAPTPGGPAPLLSDVDVTISDSQDRVLLQTMAGGPWFYAQLPRGRYDVVVQKDGTALERKVEVGWGRQTTILFDDWDARDLRASSR